MAWHWTGNKPLSEAMMVCCSDEYVRHSTDISQNENKMKGYLAVRSVIVLSKV